MSDEAKETTMVDFIALMDAEHQRQIELGWTDEHDEELGVLHLLTVAIEYCRQGKTVAAATLIRQAIMVYGEELGEASA